MMPWNLIERVKNMTRETKLGLVVSCSFLALLGAVLVMKMTERPEEEQAAELAAAAPNEESPPAGRGAPPTGPAGDGAATKSPPAPQAPAPSPFPNGVPAQPIMRTGGTNVSAGAPARSDSTPPPLPPAPVTEPAKKVKPAAQKKSSDSVAGLPDIPPVAAAPVAPPPTAAPLPAAGGPSFWSSMWETARGTTVSLVKSAPKTNPNRRNDNKPVAKADAGLPPVDNENGPKPPAAALPGPKLPPAVPPPPLPPPAAPGGGGPLTAEPPRLADAGKPAPRKDNGAELPALPAAPALPKDRATDTVPPPLPPVTPAPGAAVTGGTADKTATADHPRPAPAAPLPPVAKADPGTGGASGASTPPPPVAPVSPSPAPPTPTIEVTPAAPAKPAAPAAGPPSVKEAEPIPVGRQPRATVPALPVPSAPAPVARAGQPEVVSYTEETYTANAGDTFQSISRTKYGTEAYARALYLFNRSHPLAGDELLHSDANEIPKALRGKQQVYVPPVDILRGRYPDAVGDGRGAGVTVGSTSQRPDTGPATRSYRVATGGEKVYDIATRMLGDGNRWMEIRDLNPGWKPELPIPEGTTLRLPQ